MVHYQILSIILLKELIKLYVIICKYKHGNKKCEKYGNKDKDCECCLEYTSVRGDLIEYKCLRCNKNYQKKVFIKLFFGNSYYTINIYILVS